MVVVGEGDRPWAVRATFLRVQICALGRTLLEPRSAVLTVAELHVLAARGGEVIGLHATPHGRSIHECRGLRTSDGKPKMPLIRRIGER